MHPDLEVVKVPDMDLMVGVTRKDLELNLRKL